MTALPMTLGDALRFNGFDLTQTDADAADIAVNQYGTIGTIHVPAMRLSSLEWLRPGSPDAKDSFYLEAIPLFDAAYQPVLLSHILDRYWTRRISYDVTGMFGQAVRRFLNLSFGPMSVFNRLYVSTANLLPLTTQDATVDTTTNTLSRDAHSDFPQGQLGGNLDYATDATDQAATITSDANYQGRQGASVMALLAEQRAAYLNVDELVLDAMEALFLGVFDLDEFDAAPVGPSYEGFTPNPYRY